MSKFTIFEFPKHMLTSHLGTKCITN